MPKVTLLTARSFVYSSSSCYMHLVLIRHPWLECICRIRSDGRSLPYSWPPCEQDSEGPKRDHETGRFAVLVY